MLRMNFIYASQTPYLSVFTFHFSLFKQHDQISCQKGAHTLPSASPNFLSEWCSSGADTRNGGWDILMYFPFGAMIERSQITYYHMKEKSYPMITHRVARPNFLSKGRTHITKRETEFLVRRG